MLDRLLCACMAQMYTHTYQCNAATCCPAAQLSVPPCRRLCPANKQGKRTFAPVMLDRLQRLGINKTDPDDLTPEEVGVASTAHLPCNLHSEREWRLHVTTNYIYFPTAPSGSYGELSEPCHSVSRSH
jgi:hypothetical protein